MANKDSSAIKVRRNNFELLYAELSH